MTCKKQTKKILYNWFWEIISPYASQGRAKMRMGSDVKNVTNCRYLLGAGLAKL
jgi:hypothetical protein